MLSIFIIVYLVISLPILMLIWAIMVVTKWDNEERGNDLLGDYISFIF